MELIEGGAHQPFQEKPGEYNAIVADFWTRVDVSERIAAAALKQLLPDRTIRYRPEVAPRR